MYTHSVLLIDDKKLVLETLAHTFKKANYHVVTASNGEEALRKFKENPCNIVITDYLMENMDGIQISKIIKNLYPDTALIIFTGYPSLMSAIEALRIGVSDYIMKNCSQKELVMRVEECSKKMEARNKKESHGKQMEVCCWCKKIKDYLDIESNKGVWMDIDAYLSKKTDYQINPRICPECFDKATE